MEQPRVIRVPRPAPTPWIDTRALVVAALIASPALYRSQQGLLSGSATVERFGLIAGGCLLLSVVVRTLWPILIGSEPGRPTADASAAAADPGSAMDTSAAQGALSEFDDIDLGGLDGLDLPPMTPGATPAV